MAIVHDVTERLRAAEALRERDRLYRLALQIARIGAFELDLESGHGHAELYHDAPVGHATVSRDGTIKEANRTLATMLDPAGGHGGREGRPLHPLTPAAYQADLAVAR